MGLKLSCTAPLDAGVLAPVTPGPLAHWPVPGAEGLGAERCQPAPTW